MGLGLGRLRGTELFMQSAADRKLLTSAIDQVGEAVVLTSPENRIIYANPAALRATGYSIDELLGHPPPLLATGRLEPGFIETVRATVAAGESWHGTLLNQRKDGVLFEEDATIGPVYDDQGELVAYVAVRRDLSAERRLEADLSRQHSDRDAVAAVMRGVHPGPTLEGTARVLVRAVAALDGFAGAMVLIHQADGTIVPLAVSGVDVPGQELGVPLPIEQADGLIELVLAGPWVLDLGADETEVMLGGELTAAIRAGGITATAYAALRWDRRLTGILAVASTEADGATGLADRLGMLDELGSFAGALFGTQAAQYERIELQRDEVRAVIDGRRFHPVFQPVVELATRRMVGYEALTRFTDGTAPDVQIARAHAVGLGPELEARAWAATTPPSARPDIWLSVFPCGPSSTVTPPDPGGGAGPVRHEVTEHDRIELPALRRALASAAPGRCRSTMPAPATPACATSSSSGPTS
jgi:PAS domain S-box-containing protein